jgi:outer membrane protein assembly factor BamB
MQTRFPALLLRALPLLALSPVVCAQEWTRFRGPNGAGTSTATHLPAELGAAANRRWRTELPKGQSSPALGKDAVFVTGADDESLIVVSLDRDTGAKRWEKRLERAHVAKGLYPDNGLASPSPVTDGENVYVFFEELGLVSLDGAGEERWRLPLGPFMSFYGMAGSPILADDTVVLLCDQQRGSFMIGVDARTGAQKWRTERTGLIESWTTPVVHPSSGTPNSILVFGSFFVTAYALETGVELWRQGGVGYTPVASPVLVAGDGERQDMLFVCVPNHNEHPIPTFDAISAEHDQNKDGKVTRAELGTSDFVGHMGWIDVNRDDTLDAGEWEFARSGYATKDYGLVAYALSADGAGVTEVWRHKRSLPAIATPLVVDGLVHIVKDGGMLTTLDAATGKERGFQRLKEAEGGFNASPVAADGKLFLAASDGQVVVLSSDAEPKVLGSCDLDESIHATPAIGQDVSGHGTLFVRTAAALYCFGEPRAADSKPVHALSSSSAMTPSITFVRGLYDAFAAGDVPRFLSHLDPAVRWSEAEGFPYAKGNPYIGPDAIVAGVFQPLLSDWLDFRVEVVELVGGPEVVTMFGRYKATHARTKKALDVQCAHTWWLRGDKVVRFQQMVDTAAVAAASTP